MLGGSGVLFCLLGFAFFFSFFPKDNPYPSPVWCCIASMTVRRSRDKSSKLKRNVCSLRWQDGYSWHVHATTCTAVMNAVGWHRCIMLVGCQRQKNNENLGIAIRKCGWLYPLLKILLGFKKKKKSYSKGFVTIPTVFLRDCMSPVKISVWSLVSRGLPLE